MAEWSFSLCDRFGIPRAEVTRAAGKTLTFRRNLYHEATLTQSLEDPAAQDVWDMLRATGPPTLKAYRDGVLRFNGYLTPHTEDAEAEATQQLVFRSAFGSLIGNPGRFILPYSYKVTQKDQVQLAWDLVLAGERTFTQEFLLVVPPRVIEQGVLTLSGINRDRIYDTGKSIGEAIVELTRIQGGVEFLDRPVDEGVTLGRLDVAGTFGVDRPAARFEYGPQTMSNVRAVHRTMAPIVTRAYLLGVEGLQAVQVNPAAQTAYGESLWSASEPDVSEQATLDDKARALLRPKGALLTGPPQIVTFSPDPRLAPKPFDAWYLGDTVRLYARRGAMLIDSPARINAFTIAVDEEGNEAFEIPDPLLPDEDGGMRSSVQVEVTS